MGGYFLVTLVVALKSVQQNLSIVASSFPLALVEVELQQDDDVGQEQAGQREPGRVVQLTVNVIKPYLMHLWPRNYKIYLSIEMWHLALLTFHEVNNLLNT